MTHLPCFAVGQTWIDVYEYVQPTDKNVVKYVAAVYYSIATLSTVGYGDIHPATHEERVAASILTIVGASVYAFMVGK